MQGDGRWAASSITTREVVEVASPEHCDRQGLVPAARRLLDRLTVYGATATAVIFLSGLVVSLVGICFVRHPYLGWSDNVALDAKAVATGHLPVREPGDALCRPTLRAVIHVPVRRLVENLLVGRMGARSIHVGRLAAALFSMVRMLWVTAHRTSSAPSDCECRCCAVFRWALRFSRRRSFRCPPRSDGVVPARSGWDSHVPRRAPVARGPIPQADGAHRSAPHRLCVLQADHARALPARVGPRARRGDPRGTESGNGRGGSGSARRQF